MTLPSTRRKSSSRTASTAGPFVTSACHLAVLGTRPWEQSPWTGLLRSDPCQNSEPPISVLCVAPSLPHPLTLPAGHSLGNSQTLAAATTTTQRGSAPTRRWPVLTETRQRPPVFATLCESSRFGPRPHQRTARATRPALLSGRPPDPHSAVGFRDFQRGGKREAGPSSVRKHRSQGERSASRRGFVRDVSGPRRP